MKTQTHGVVLLATDKPQHGLCIQADTKKMLLYPSSEHEHEEAIYVDIHITSDSEIKEENWCYDTLRDCIWQKSHEITCNGSIYKKILATTDTSLYTFQQESKEKLQKLRDELWKDIEYMLDVNRVGAMEQISRWDEVLNVDKHWQMPLPQIPQEYIQYYVEQYNKGNVIEKCEVEYEEKCIGCGAYPAKGMSYCTYPKPDEHQRTLAKYLKLNPDNTINIVTAEEDIYFKHIKEALNSEEKMYSREEVLNILHKLLSDMHRTECGILNVELKMVFEKDLFLANFNMDEWIKENL